MSHALPEGPLDPHLFGERSACFGCAPSHPIGFHLRFAREGDSVVTTFVPGQMHQGPPAVMHGGLVATLADEIAAWALIALLGKFGFTAEFQGRDQSPGPHRRGARRAGRIERDGGRIVGVRVELTQGEALAFTGLFTFVIHIPFEVKAGDGQRFAVTQESTQTRAVSLAGLDEVSLALYAKSGKVDAETRAALAKLGGLRAAQADAERAVTQTQTQTDAVVADQTRLKDLLGAVAAGSDSQKRYLKKARRRRDRSGDAARRVFAARHKFSPSAQGGGGFCGGAVRLRIVSPSCAAPIFRRARENLIEFSRGPIELRAIANCKWNDAALSFPRKRESRGL